MIEDELRSLEERKAHSVPRRLRDLEVGRRMLNMVRAGRTT